MDLGTIIETCKSKAWNAMKKCYWWAFLLCLIASFLGAATFQSSGSGGGASGSGSGFNFSQRDREQMSEVLEQAENELIRANPDYSYEIRNFFNEIEADDEAAAAVILVLAVILIYLIIFLPLFLVIFAIAETFRLLVSFPVSVGKYHYFIHLEDSEESPKKIGELFSSFKISRYGHVIVKLFLQELYISLWTLLFIIPGVIKSFSYFMVPYLCAENPRMTSKRAFQISRETMNGNKWNLFVLQLSFIGWELLCVLTCGLGFIFLAPYYEATIANFYELMKTQSIEKGIASADEFVI